MLLRLKVKPRTLTPPLLRPADWQPKILTNAIKINSQTTLIVKRIREHKSSSPNLIIKIVLQVKRGAVKRDYLHTLLKVRIAKLKEVN